VALDFVARELVEVAVDENLDMNKIFLMTLVILPFAIL